MSKSKNYRQLNNELEEVMAKLQSGEVDIDESLELFTKAQTIIKQLGEYLKMAENKVSKVPKKAVKN